MHSSTLLALATTVVTAAAQYKGFNYGSTFTNGAAKQEADFVNEFNTARNLVGTSGFTSARLFTTIQAGTANTPISAISAAISTKTSLLLGLWASAGQGNIDNEIAALTAAINQYGTAFTDLIVGISVGSEDLYRNSPTGILNKSGIGANPDDIVKYINQVRQAIANTAANGKPIGHVDTWTAYVNASNNAVISALDFVGVDAYPYFQNTQANGIENGAQLFNDAYAATVAAAQGKPVWITETGWPVSGPTENQAVANVANAKAYWDSVGCSRFGTVNTCGSLSRTPLPILPAPASVSSAPRSALLRCLTLLAPDSPLQAAAHQQAVRLLPPVHLLPLAYLLPLACLLLPAPRLLPVHLQLAQQTQLPRHPEFPPRSQPSPLQQLQRLLSPLPPRVPPTSPAPSSTLT